LVYEEAPPSGGSPGRWLAPMVEYKLQVTPIATDAVSNRSKKISTHKSINLTLVFDFSQYSTHLSRSPRLTMTSIT
jgi:hypothetical protein